MRFLPHILLLFLSLFVQNLLGQRGEHRSTVNPYSKYKDSSFECEFKSNDKTILLYCDKSGKNSCSNHLNSHFDADSTYRIVMTLLEKKDSMVVGQEYIFDGKFKIDTEGTILLAGKHPFNSSSIKIKETKYKDGVYMLGYKFKLNDDYKWANKQKIVAYCDGPCIIPKEE